MGLPCGGIRHRSVESSHTIVHAGTAWRSSRGPAAATSRQWQAGERPGLPLRGVVQPPWVSCAVQPAGDRVWSPGASRLRVLPASPRRRLVVLSWWPRASATMGRAVREVAARWRRRGRRLGDRPRSGARTGGRDGPAVLPGGGEEPTRCVVGDGVPVVAVRDAFQRRGGDRYETGGAGSPHRSSTVSQSPITSSALSRTIRLTGCAQRSTMPPATRRRIGVSASLGNGGRLSVAQRERIAARRRATNEAARRAAAAVRLTEARPPRPRPRP